MIPNEATELALQACFRYQLLDIVGRDVSAIERQVPLRADDTIVLPGNDAWRIVAVLGRSATVVRA